MKKARKTYNDYREDEIASLARLTADALRRSPMAYTSNVARTAAAFIDVPNAENLARLLTAATYAYEQRQKIQSIK